MSEGEGGSDSDGEERDTGSLEELLRVEVSLHESRQSRGLLSHCSTGQQFEVHY